MAKILIINCCEECKWYIETFGLCSEPKRMELTGNESKIYNPFIIDPDCLLQDDGEGKE
jgi:hypothetical protein